MQKTTLPLPSDVDINGVPVDTVCGRLSFHFRKNEIIDWVYAFSTPKLGVGFFLFCLRDDGAWYICPKMHGPYTARTIRASSVTPPIPDMETALIALALLK